jgi:hypothetical protein
MVVMSVSPSIEREMNIYTYKLTQIDIHTHIREKGKMSHVMKLYEEPYTVERMDSPSKKP